MIPNNQPNYHYTADGTRIFYSTNFNEGENRIERPLLVFVYGLVCNNEHWKWQIEYFDKNNYDLLIHDFRGHYNSSGNEDINSCTFKNFSEDLHGLVSRFQRKKIFLLGHSMGVNVALEYATRFPANIEGIVLISGAATPPHDFMFGSNISQTTIPILKSINTILPKVVSSIWKNGYRAKLIRTIVLRGGFNHHQTSDDFVKIYLKKLGELPIELFFKLLEEMEQHSVINHLDKITAPVLLIGGDKDELIPNKSQEVLKKYLKKSEFYIVHEGSHVPQVDFPRQINDRIEAFIQLHS
jgi:non-heme chloroperoxidase